ncbi:hypothetical protein HH213_14965 [Duganella dendranthematis]|uniref:Recombinase RecT n=1 Tax=Duganella dendranthematis TaxID=2728021 RepID=A0ABX6MAA8_9BURK|nr:hypothetical protein [Duganella dendranthematis]QJD91259.1 hypothetical protein HH213_14965 [Duganella dendranthematis]
MDSTKLQQVRELISGFSDAEKDALFSDLREGRVIHEFENVIGAPAEMILEAVHTAPELTRRMLRGVIADAAFRTNAVEPLKNQGWVDVTPEGNFAYDYKLEDAAGPVTVQVKLQRSAKGAPVVRSGAAFGMEGEVFVTETQKTRTGNDGDEKTRPYRYGEFDILAVSMQPSTGQWNRYMYTVGRWLIEGKSPNEMATIQPVAKTANEFWTDDFNVAASWLRADDQAKRMTVSKVSRKKS